MSRGKHIIYVNILTKYGKQQKCMSKHPGASFAHKQNTLWAAPLPRKLLTELKIRIFESFQVTLCISYRIPQTWPAVTWRIHGGLVGASLGQRGYMIGWLGNAYCHWPSSSCILWNLQWHSSPWLHFLLFPVWTVWDDMWDRAILSLCLLGYLWIYWEVNPTYSLSSPT